MHSRGYAHMDIKPHNVLIKRPNSPPPLRQRQQQPVLLTSPPRLTAPAVARAVAGEDEELEAEDDEADGDLGAGRILESSRYR